MFCTISPEQTRLVKWSRTERLKQSKVTHTVVTFAIDGLSHTQLVEWSRTERRLWSISVSHTKVTVAVDGTPRSPGVIVRRSVNVVALGW